MKKIILILSVVLLSSCTPHSQLIKAYEDYYKQVELMLDDFCYQDECFMDTFGESESYSNYYISRIQLEEILNK